MKDFEEIAKEQAQKQGTQNAAPVNAAVKQKSPLKKSFNNWWIWLLAIAVFSVFFVFVIIPSALNDNSDADHTPSPEELEITENSYVRTISEEVIKKILKTPKSAEFPIIDEWEFERGDVSYYKIAHSYVDYDNVFGTEVRSYFYVTVKITEEGYQAVRIVFDGETVCEDVFTIAADVAAEEID